MFGKTFELKSERLILKYWKQSDAKGLYNYAKQPDVGPNAGWKPHENIEESKRIIRQVFLTNTVFKIMRRDTNEIIGSIGLEKDKRRERINSRELGYSLSHDYWGKGIMTEAATLVVNFAFIELGLEVLAIQTAPDNLRSQRVIEKLGFVYEGTQRNGFRTYDDKVRDVLVYSILRDEWKEKYVNDIKEEISK